MNVTRPCVMQWCRLDLLSSDMAQNKLPSYEALNQLLQKAGAAIGEDDESFQYDRTHPSYRMEREQQRGLRRSPADIMMAIIIALLVILVIILFFWHH